MQAALATDDLLPLVVWCLLHVPLAHVPSHLAFTSQLAFGLADVHELSFNLVTLQAALHYIQADLPAMIAPPAAPVPAPSRLPAEASPGVPRRVPSNRSGVPRSGSMEKADRPQEARAAGSSSLLLRLSRGY